jgi:hypothetical protein
VAVILAVSKGGFNAIVGTAISASLLPPIVNSGLCLALGIQFSSNGISSDNDQARKYLQYAGVGASVLIWFIVSLAHFSHSTPFSFGSSILLSLLSLASLLFGLLLNDSFLFVSPPLL